MGFVPGLTTQIETFLTNKGAQQIMTNGIGIIKYFAVSDDASNYVTSDPLTYNQVFTLGGKLLIDNKSLSVVNDQELNLRILVDNSSETFKGFLGESGSIIIEESVGGINTSNFYNIYSYTVNRNTINYQLNWVTDLRLPYGAGDNIAWSTPFNGGGFSNTAISDMYNNEFLLFNIDGSQHAIMDGKSIKMTLPYYTSTVDIYGTFLNTNMNRSFYDGQYSDQSQYMRRFGSNAILLFCDDIMRPNGGNPSLSWSTGYNYSNAPFTQGAKSLANYVSNGSLNKDTAVGIAYLDKGVIVIFNNVLYNGYVGRSNDNISINNRNLTRRSVVNYICDLPIGNYTRSQNPTFTTNTPIRISSIGLFNENKELMAIGRFNQEVTKNPAQRLTFMVKLVI
jgi:hypothetical protein